MLTVKQQIKLLAKEVKALETKMLFVIKMIGALMLKHLIRMLEKKAP